MQSGRLGGVTRTCGEFHTKTKIKLVSGVINGNGDFTISRQSEISAVAKCKQHIIDAISHSGIVGRSIGFRFYGAISNSRDSGWFVFGTLAAVRRRNYFVWFMILRSLYDYLAQPCSINIVCGCLLCV